MARWVLRALVDGKVSSESPGGWRCVLIALVDGEVCSESPGGWGGLFKALEDGEKCSMCKNTNTVFVYSSLYIFNVEF